MIETICGDRPTDWLKDHATRSVTIGGANSGVVGQSPSEPCKNSLNNRDAVSVDDSGGPKKTRVAYSKT